MSNLYEGRHQRQNLSEDADQTEIEALRTGQAILDQGLYDERIADALDDFGIGETSQAAVEPDWVSEDLQQDDAVGGLIALIERRENILKPYYPFQRTANTLIHTLSHSLVYEFCLVASTTTERENHLLPRVFERLSAILVRRYLGSEGESLHTGWPSKPARFKATMAPLNSRTGEWCWHPDHGLPDDPASRDIKDEGLDFVAWLPHLDKRVGNLFLLGQCACGDNWENKYSDINLNRLKRWFGPMTHIPPVRAFCVPFHVTGQLLIEASQTAGLVFDRLRLALLAETADPGTRAALAELKLGQYL